MPAYNMALKAVLLIYVPGKQQPFFGQTKGDTDII